MKKLKIAIVQQPTAVLNLKEGVSRAANYIRKAAKEGGDLVVFPESWLTGYPAWVFGMAGWDDKDARYWYGRFLEECPTADSATLAPIRKAVKDTGVIVSLGLNERSAGAGGSVFNSIFLIGPDGKTLNIHRKLTPTHTERIIWAQGDATGLQVIDTKLGKIGGLVCWENWHPLIRQAMHSQHEQVHIACWPDMPESHSLCSRHYAFEGRCFVVAAAQYLTVDDVPEPLVEIYRAGLGEQAASGDVLLRGGSAVAGPNGEWVIDQVFDEGQLIFTEIDIGETREFKHDLDVVGHYSRADIFNLTVDRSAQKSVILKDQ